MDRVSAFLPQVLPRASNPGWTPSRRVPDPGPSDPLVSISPEGRKLLAQTPATDFLGAMKAAVQKSAMAKAAISRKASRAGEDLQEFQAEIARAEREWEESAASIQADTSPHGV